MRKMKKSAAFIALLAFLISALVPVSAFAGAPAAEVVERAAAVQTEGRAAESSGQGSAAARLAPVDGLEVTDKKATLTKSLKDDVSSMAINMLVNAPGYTLDFDAVEVPDAPVDPETGDPYEGKWTVAWDSEGPSGQKVTGGSKSGTRWSGVNSITFNEVGEWRFTCTASWAPAVETAPDAVATFVVNALGMGLEKIGEYAGRTMLPVNAEELDKGEETGVVYAQFPLEVGIKEPAGGAPMQFPDNQINVGPTDIEVKSFEWTADRTPLANWHVTTQNKPATVKAQEDLEKGTFSLLMELDGANFTAGIAHYTCRASGVGVDSSDAGAATFEAQVVPFLEAVIAGDPSDKEQIAPNIVELKYKYQPSITKPLEVKWRAGIGVEDATYIWKQDNGTYDGFTVQDSSKDNPARGPLVYLLPISITEGAVKYTCDVTSKHLTDVAAVNTHTDHFVSVFSDITPPSVVIQRVTMGTPTPIMDESLTVMGGIDLMFHAQVQGSGTASDIDLLTYEWEVVRADGSNGVLRDNKTADLKIENVSFQEHNGNTYTVKVYNRTTGYTSTASITLLVEDAPQPPEVRSASTPDHNGGLITRTEKKPIVMKAEVANAVNPKAVQFEWQQKTPDGQWEKAKGGTEKRDATGLISEYTISSPTIKDHNEMMYRCAVSTKVGAKESPQIYTKPEFQLQILPQTGLVSFVEPEEDQTFDLESGNGKDFKVKAETDQGQAPVYQWYHASAATSSSIGDHQLGDPIPGATKDTYSTGRLPAGFHKFTCRATNKQDAEMFADRVFKLNVSQAPTQPIVKVKGDLKRGAMVGDTISFEVEAHTQTGDPVSYKWERRSGDKGAWTAVTGGARRMLTLRDVKTSDNNTQLRCVVTNTEVPDSFFESDVITLSVWNPKDVPEIIEQPKSMRILTGSQGAANATLTVVVATKGKKDAYEFEWYYRAHEDDDWKLTDLQWEELAGTDEAKAVLKVPDDKAVVGEYYCVITNPAGSPPGAQAKSDVAKVEIMERHVPMLTYESHDKQYTSVGNTAVLRVVADIEPAEPLIYNWQTSPDGGETWRNCSKSDGDGFNTESFTTQTITSEMVGYALYFRCAVTGQDNGVVTYSRVKQIIPKEPSPELKPIEKTHLRVEVDPRTGERYMTGHTVGKLEDALTPIAIRDAMYIDDVKDGKIEVRHNGEIVKDTDPVPTGAIVTLLDAKDIPLDDITVVIKGDVLGTAKSELSQIVALAGAVRGKSSLEGAFAKASDHNNNGKIGEVSDLVAQAKIFRGAGGTPPEPTEMPDPDASAQPSGSAKPTASANPSASPSASASASASPTR